MKIGELIGLVQLAVNGGKPSDDNSVLSSDIKAYLPAAVNEALNISYMNNKNTEGTIGLPSSLYSYYCLPVNNNCRPFLAEMPVDVVSMVSDYGYGSVSDDAGNVYAPVPPNAAAMANFNYYSQTAPGVKWYKLIGKRKIQIFTDNPFIESISIQCIVDVNSLSEDDEAPIQAGLETRVLDVLIAWFSGQRQRPYEVLNNDQDVNSVTK